MSNQWNSVGAGFCENLFDEYPEIVNCVTSFSMLLIGMMGLFRSNVQPYVMKSIYADLVTNWFGSFFVHYNGYKFYGNIDTISMLCVSWSVSYIVGTALISYIPNIRLRECIDDLYCTFTRGFLILSIASVTVDGKPWGGNFGFVEAFVVPNVISIFGMIVLVIMNWNKLPIRGYVYFFLGLGLMIFTVIIWGVTEPLCKKLRVTGETPDNFLRVSHGVWHIFFTLGAHYFIQVVLFVKLLTEDKPVYFSSDCPNWVIPIVNT